MPRYLLIGGNHDQAGKKYKKGQTVESEVDLTEMFPEKFTLVADVIGPDGKIVQTPVAPPPKIPAPTEQNKVKAAEGVVKTEKKVDDEEAVLENEVSADFHDAAKINLRVVKHSNRRFNVLDPQDLETPLNDSPITKGDVEKLLKKFLEA